MNLTEVLQTAEAALKKLTSSPIVQVVEAALIKTIVREFVAPTVEEIHNALNEAWKWVEDLKTLHVALHASNAYVAGKGEVITITIQVGHDETPETVNP